MNLYLRPDVKAELLIWQWYVWPYLIAPATAACNILDRHITIMESYVNASEVHAQAVKSPKLLGGPFIDLGGERVDEVQQLLDKTRQDCATLISLATSIKEFDRVLQSKAQGGSLEELYDEVPDNLKGLVELTYDLNNHPSLRFIEPLIYRKYYNADFQTVALSRTQEDDRSFVLSTPRFENDNELHIKIPFNDKRIDELFEMRYQPQPIDKIRSLFDFSIAKASLFESFFTETPPELGKDRNYKGEGVRLRYFGHACVLLETKDVSILIDPILSYVYPTEIDRFTFNDLPDKIDYVLLTHNHQDHVLLETLVQLRHKIKSIIVPSNNSGALADPSLKLILKTIGFSSVIQLSELEAIPLPEGEIIGLPFLGEHSDLNIFTKLAHYINIKGNKILFAADSNNLENKIYEYLFEIIGNIDLLFVGMECDGAPLTWLYGPLLSTPLKRSFDDSRCLSGSNFKKAWEIAKHSGCKKAYVYAMGQEPWFNHILALKYTPDSLQIKESDLFVKTCQNNGIEAERLFGKKEWIL